MFKFIAGVILGIVLSTIGLDGVAHMMHKAAPHVDSAVSQVKDYAKENVK